MKQKQPLYTLPHGIEVIGEYRPNSKCPYWRVRVRPHPLIVGKVVSNGIEVRRSRAVATSILRRVIGPEEHVHHENGKEDDDPKHLEVLAAAKHNAHHKTGTTHKEGTKTKISESLKRAYAEGRKAPPAPREQRGEANSQSKLTRAQALEIRASAGTHTSIAKKYGVSRRTVGLIKQGVTWK